MATTLWPIIHRLSNLLPLREELENAIAAHQSSKVAVLRTEFDTTSQAIEAALKQWQPSLPPSFSPEERGGDVINRDQADERARLQSIMNNALAYRHSAFVYLYRSIYGCSRRHAIVQRHAHVSLTHCVATVAHAGPMGALLWPLFVAACEAVSLGDRDLARQAFVAIDRRQGMTNIERAWLIVQEVWKRADLMEQMTGSAGSNDKDLAPPSRKRTDLWRGVSRDMGVTIVFG
jgi:Fungal specific transcription factor domain